MFKGRLFTIDNFYADIESVYGFSKVCPKRSFQLDYLVGMESTFGYPSQSTLGAVTRLLGGGEVIDKTDEQSLFGLFRYLLAGEKPDQISVHNDTQPWTMIVYISPTQPNAGTGLFRHRETGISDLSILSENERASFVSGPLIRDQYEPTLWECIYSVPFVQNTAVIFNAGHLLHSNMGTWGNDIETCRVTQNFNFQLSK